MEAGSTVKPRPNNPFEGWIGCGEVGRRLKVTPQYASCLAQNGLLVAVKVGYSWAVDPASVEDYKQHRRGMHLKP